VGDWGSKPRENDEAADWFHKLWKYSDFSIVINEIQNFRPEEEKYDSFRAACYVLQSFGNPYMWPSKNRELLRELLDTSIGILEKMIDSPGEAWGFLDMWGNDPKVIVAVKQQIGELRMRRSELAPK